MKHIRSAEKLWEINSLWCIEKLIIYLKFNKIQAVLFKDS